MDEEHAALQRQIVELRLQLSHLSDTLAAIVQTMVRKELDMELRNSLLNEEQARWVRERMAAEEAAKKRRTELWMHAAKWGLGGVLGFAAWSAWEGVKAKLGIKP